MANKTVGVNIAFNADTSKAKAQIQELQTLLNKITYSNASSNGQKGLSDELKNASAAAKELQYHLNNAYNANTGKLDLSLLDKSLKTTGSNITNLSTQLLSAGNTGQQAFVKMAQAISQAEQPMLKINDKVKDFANTLKNAAKYQIGNIVVQGLMGSLSSAVDYAKDLNTSLNEIRIVSGSSADEMARFAEEANKAAKKLSSTTLDYTNASLIYYQQGLSDAEVQARTETTLKMANVAGTSAQTVSDQMTAVWNNFYDGSKSLEYYSDVMVELGAATASSTDEISEGVNKFAATAKTVGLSYEYATAALATVTARTRESADTVGNAFKTLFSRIQGLNLGETLDDGTTLNKYSKALNAVGINIKDQSGQLKEMDQILDEMGDKWSTLGDAEKMALAQTVGGARQYTQLMALMENWDYFKENLDVAYNSEGALEKQQEIYAESWDAASDRVKASIQGVYQALLDDKFFISLNNGFANALGGLEAFIEGAGGAKTVITGLASVILGAFAEKIPDALKTVKYNFDLLTKGSEAAYQKIQSDMQKATNTAFDKYKATSGDEGIDVNSSTGMELQYANDLLAAKNKLAQITDKMSAAEKQQYETELSLIEAHQKETVSLREQTEELERNIEVQRQEMLGAAKSYGFDDEKVYGKVNNIYDKKQGELLTQSGRFSDAGLDSEAQKAYNKSEEYTKAVETYSEIIDKLKEFESKINDSYDSINDTIVNKLATGDTEGFGLKNYFESAIGPLDEVKEKLENINNLDIDSDDKLLTMKTAVSAISDSIPEAVQKATGLSQIFAKIGKESSTEELLKDIDELIKAMDKAELEGKDFKNVLKAFQDNKDVNKFSSNVDALADKIKKLNGNKEALDQLMDSFKPAHVVSTTEAVASLASSLGSVATIGNTIKSLGETITNPDLSGWEAFSSIMIGLTSLVPTVTSTMKQLATVQDFLNGKKQALLVTMATEKAAQETQNALQAKNVIISTLGLNVTNHQIQRKQLDQALAKAGITLEQLQQKLKEKNIILDTASNTQLLTSIQKHKEEVVAILAENVAKNANVQQTKSQIIWQTILNALTGQYGKLIMVAVGAAVIAGITALVKGIKSAAAAQKEAVEATQASLDAYDEQKSKVDSLNSELEELGKTIDDLLSKGTLSVVEQEQLANAQKQEASLKQQLAYEQAILEIKQKQAIYDWKSGSDEYDNWVETAEAKGYQVMSIQKTSSGDEEGTDYLYQSGTQMIRSKDEFDDYFYNDYVDYLKQQNKLNYTSWDEEGNEVWDETGFQTLVASTYANMLDDFETANNDYLKYIANNAGSYVTDLEGYQTWYNSLTDEDKQDEAIQAEMAQYQARLQSQAKLIYGDNYYDAIDDNFGYGKNEKKAKGLLEGGTLSANNESNISQLSSSYSQEFKDLLAFMGMSVDDFAKHQIEEYSNYGKALENTDVKLADLTSRSDWKDEYYSLLQEMPIEAGTTIEQIIQQLQEKLSTLPEQQFDLSSWKSQYAALQEVIDDVAKGDSIDSDAYGQLGEEYQQYFREQLDGTYALTIAAEEFKKIVQETEVDKLKEDVEDKKAQISDVVTTGINNGMRKDTTFEDIDFSVQYAKDQINANSAAADEWVGGTLEKTLSESLGITQAEGQSNLDYMQSLISAWESLLNALDESQVSLGQSADSIHQLDKYLEERRIDAEDYAEALDSVIKAEAEANDIDYSDVEDYAKILRANNKELSNNIALSKKMALAYLKTEKGVKKIKDSQDDWQKAIKNSNKDVVSYLKTVDEIKDAYKQVFNSIDPEVIDNLSNEFLTSTSTMNLMSKALSGSEQDWNNWEAAVLAEINNTSSAFAYMTEDMKLKMTELTTMAANLDFSGLTPGADIKDEAFLAKLSEMTFATEEAALAMSNNLSSVGVDAEIVPHTEEVPPQTTHVSQIGTMTITPPGGEPYYIDINSGYDQIAEGTEYTWYTLEGATYNGRGVRPASAAPATTGGGGGGSTKTPKHAEKKSDSDKERYHTLLNQLEDLNAEYDNISEAKDRAFGKDKLKNLDAEIAKTDELIDKQEEYLDAIEANLPVDKAVMDAYYQDTIGGPAIEYDEKGNIANYDAIQDAMFAKYNAMADAYDEDSTEWQVFEKEYEQLEKYIEQYEETYDLLRDQEQEYQDLLNQRIDLQLEKVQYTVELKLNVSEDQVKLIEYQLGKVEDDGFKALETIGLLTNKAGELNKQIEANKQGLNDALKLSLSAAEIAEVMADNMDVLNGKNFTDDQISAIKDYRDSLLDLNEQLDEIREQVEEQLMAAFDAWQEKLEKGIDTIDHYGSVLEGYKNIIDIVGTDTLGLSDEFMNNLSQGSVDNAINKLEAVNAEYKAVESSRAEAEKMLAEARAAGDTKSAEMWEETLEDLTEKSQEAQENMLSAWEDALSKVAEQFEQSVERIVNNFNKSVYKMGGLEGLSNDFAKQQEEANMMLDDYQKIYELSKLSRDINKSIDDTDLIGGKQKLKKLLGEVNALQEDGVEMSQYDLEYLQKTYDLRLAELELEEAQRAKNTVRLSKDNEGNWSYVYTQNTDAVDAAQQKYEDALYAMQDLSSNYIDEMSEKLIETSQEMAEALAELRVEDFASIDEYYAEVDRVQKYYQEQMDFQEEELNKAIENNKVLYDEDWLAYHNATGYKISDTKDFVTSFKDSILGGLVASESDTANFTDLIKGSVNTLTEQLLAAANTYYENVQNAMNAADTSVEDFGNDVGAAVDKIAEKSEEGAKAVENMADRMNTAVGGVMTNIQSWQETYGKAMEQIVQDNLKVIESINDLVGTLSLEDFDASVSWNFTPKESDDEEVDTGYDTGGYTGAWGKNGKLAILHEKELVLNAEDTVNMLSMLQLTHDLLDMIDLQTQTAKLGFGDLVASTIKDSQKEVLEQKVEITAEFPNVTDHNEIEEALMNLTNTASQYANRK